MLIALVGTIACRLAVVPRAADTALGPRLHSMLGGALALATLASFGILLSRTLELNGGAWAELWQDLRPAITATHFGHVWLWRLPALAVLWLAWSLGARQPRSNRAAAEWMLLAAAVIALTRSDTGHPADHGDFTLAVWVDWLHLMAAATWVGSLFGMTLAVFPHLLRDPKTGSAMGLGVFQRLSTLSGIALAVLVACGAYSAVQQLGSVHALWTTRYGALLTVKLALVLTMIGIGAHNRYVKLPSLQAASGASARTRMIARWLQRLHAASVRTDAEVLRSCARAVLIEGLLGLAVIGVTAILIHAMPPGDMPSMDMAAASHADAATASAQGGSVVATGCWIRQLPAPIPSAGYLTVHNNGSHAIVLESARSPDYGAVMMHETTESNGVSSMSMAHDLTVAAGGEITFAPGHYHLMLEQPRAELKIGDTARIDFTLTNGQGFSAACAVEGAAAMPPGAAMPDMPRGAMNP
ncbi:MAG: copper chaperone PCu(A)C [Burkholderiaceae bacterium]|nr:MAG: copper chaperone PCu(A)C [Burkholderiaceae bacterium]